MDRRARRMVQYAVSLLGMQRNDVETERKTPHVPSHRRYDVQYCPMVDVQGVLAVKVTCAICGFTADVTPGQATINDNVRAVRPVRTGPQVWICDIHVTS